VRETVVRGIAALVLAIGVLAAPLSPAAAQGAPPVTLSADGRTATAGPMTLTVSQAADVQPGQTVTVSGSGFDPEKGVYVALCVVPPTNLPPSPCGGGQDRAGTGGYSEWVSSNPPSYARGLTVPYGLGGTFTVTLTLAPNMPGGLDCYSVRCAIYTRADHTRSQDRSLDVGIPVTFAAAAPTTAAPPPPPPTTAAPEPTTTLPPETTTTTEPPTTTSTTEAAPDDDVDVDDADEDLDVALAATEDEEGGGGSGALPVVLAVGALVVIGAVAAVLLSRRQAGAAGEGAP